MGFPQQNNPKSNKKHIKIVSIVTFGYVCIAFFAYKLFRLLQKIDSTKNR